MNIDELNNFYCFVINDVCQNLAATLNPPLVEQLKNVMTK